MADVRGAWEVVAGVVPGQPLPEFTKQFWYTSEALAYATQLANPARLNWV